VRINLQSADVIHAFFVPEFNYKRDVIPGVTNHFDITIPKAGTFRGECAELCGVNHSDMTFFIKAVPLAEFQAWVAMQQQSSVGVGGTG
jgi:cytochrome c oxidase subunit 2